MWESVKKDINLDTLIKFGKTTKKMINNRTKILTKVEKNFDEYNEIKES